jgi:hypothetical protein
MKWTLFFCLLAILGSAAVPAHAQTLTDPTYITHGSPCVMGDPYCESLVYTGETECWNVTSVLDKSGDCVNPFPLGPLDTALGTEGQPFLFALATSITIPIGDEYLYNCFAEDLPGIEFPDFVNNHNGTATFEGCNYYGILENGQGITWNSTAPDSPLAESADYVETPEPSSFVLFTSGLVLFCLAGFARRRLGANFST